MATFLHFGLLILTAVGCSIAEDSGTCGLDGPKAGCSSPEDAVEAERYSEAANSVDSNAPGGEPVAAADSTRSDAESAYWKGKRELHIGIVVCNDRAPEALVMLKSALMFSRSPLHYHMFVQDDPAG